MSMKFQLAVNMERLDKFVGRDLIAAFLLSPLMIPHLVLGVAFLQLYSSVTSFDELTMSVFVASPATQMLPVKMYYHITQTIDPLIASVSTVLIVLTFLVMLILDRFYGLDKIFIGKGWKCLRQLSVVE